MKNFILSGIACLFMASSPCLAQEKETAIYAVYPYLEIDNALTKWSITLPEQAEATIESVIGQGEQTDSPFSAVNLPLYHDGKTWYYETAQEKFTLWGYREAQVVHTFETPVANLESLWEQSYSAVQLTFFGKRNQTLRSIPMGRGTLNTGAEKTEVTLVKTVEEITETALNPYRKVRVRYCFFDDKSRLPLFESITDTLYTDGGTKKRIISFSIYRKQQTTGIEHVPGENSLSVYPNPTKGDFRIETADPDPGTVKIYDFAGKLQKTIRISNGCSDASISNLPAGTYLLKHLSQTSHTCIKLIKL